MNRRPKIVIYSLIGEDGEPRYELELHDRACAYGLGVAFNHLQVVAVLADYLAGGMVDDDGADTDLPSNFAQAAEEYRREHPRSGRRAA
jgi:hypothetical protein